ncbi:MAG TPA: hypothetical protein VEX38_04720 [Fimbriimonadaceae bacterium]|nr:hypothetical protein [Fimbriimonadaceae bacterium]
MDGLVRLRPVTPEQFEQRFIRMQHVTRSLLASFPVLLGQNALRHDRDIFWHITGMGVLISGSVLLIYALVVGALWWSPDLQYEFTQEGYTSYLLRRRKPELRRVWHRVRWSDVDRVHAHSKALILTGEPQGLRRFPNEIFASEEQREIVLSFAALGGARFPMEQGSEESRKSASAIS